MKNKFKNRLTLLVSNKLDILKYFNSKIKENQYE